MTNIEKFEKLRKLYDLKSQYHKREISSAFVSMKEKFSKAGFIQDILLIGQSANNLYQLAAAAAEKEAE